MLGNIVDGRTDRFCTECDAVFEPSAHDNAIQAEGTPRFDYDAATEHDGYFIVVDQLDTTVREAILRAETGWPCPVTVFLYDKGSGPLG